MSATSTSCSDASSEDSDTAEAAEAARRAAWFSEVDGREEEKATKAAALFGDTPLQPPAVEQLVPDVDFSASAAFAGQREGWIFRVGTNGTGYYRDKPLASTQSAADGGSAELFGYLDRTASITRSFDESAGSSHQRSDSRDHGAASDGDGDNEGVRKTGGLSLRQLESVRDGLLGEGAQSRVYLYRHPNPPSGHVGELQYAVKTIKKAGLSERSAARIVDEKAALSATNALWARSQTSAVDTVRSAYGRPVLPVPPVVRLLGTDQDHECLYLIQEFLSKGQLTELVRGTNPHFLAPLPPVLARYYLASLALAVDIVHRAGFIHRDVKLDNVMLDGEARIRLIDFGLCKRIWGTDESEDTSSRCMALRCGSLVGTAGCVAPEVLAKQPYGCSADWWAVGVAGFHLLTGAPPHDPACEGAIVGGWNNPINRSAIARWVARLHEPPPTCAAIRTDLDDESMDLGAGGGAEPVLHRLLDPDPTTRLCATHGLNELKECAWFEGFDWEALHAGRLLPPEQSFSFDLQGATSAALEREPAAAPNHNVFADF